jgi:hypothetical protein
VERGKRTERCRGRDVRSHRPRDAAHRNLRSIGRAWTRAASAEIAGTRSRPSGGAERGPSALRHGGGREHAHRVHRNLDVPDRHLSTSSRASVSIRSYADGDDRSRRATHPTPERREPLEIRQQLAGDPRGSTPDLLAVSYPRLRGVLTNENAAQRRARLVMLSRDLITGRIVRSTRAAATSGRHQGTRTRRR